MQEENPKWGVGNRAKEKAFDTVTIGHGEHTDTLELIFGEHPHSRQDNNIYARLEGRIEEFSGHRRPFKIVIEEYNYMKRSDLSGNEIRNGGNVKVFMDGIQVFDGFCRSYESGYRTAHNFIVDMEEQWGWFPKKLDEWLGKTVGYREQLFKINSFVVSQACMVLKTLDGKPRKKFLYEDDEDFEEETQIKVEITSDAITWYPKHQDVKDEDDDLIKK